MTANRKIKARPKAGPSRIQSNIRLDQAIVDRSIVANSIEHVAEVEEFSLEQLPTNREVSVPLSVWQEHKAVIQTRPGPVAVQIAADEEVEDIADDLSDIDMIVLPFVSHADGRSYTHAYKLRTRFQYQGQIRAVGDVKFDQLDFLTRVGCNAFELPEGENLSSALKAFSEFSEVYQPAADNHRLIFSRRRPTH